MKRRASRTSVLVMALTIGSLVGLAPTAGAAAGGGSRILFERIAPDGSVDLWAMDGAGGRQALFLEDAADADFAPSGRRIAFDRSWATEPPDIFVSDVDGSNVVRLTDEPGFDFFPDWSPDGQRITFTSDRDGKPDIYAMAADGSDVRRITDEPNGAQGSEYSPDGRGILITTVASGIPQVAVVDADGGTPVVLTDGPDFEPTWSPDGRHIAFISARDGTRELYVMTADGTDQTRLSADAFPDVGPPAFAPSGNVVAFMSLRAGNWDIYSSSLAPKTGETRRLTTDSAIEGFPEWRQGALVRP